MVLLKKNLKFFHVFSFCKKQPAKCVYDILDILESKKALFLNLAVTKSCTCSDHIKNYKEQQAIPSVHGIH